jgi:hypothetical protein
MRDDIIKTSGWTYSIDYHRVGRDIRYNWVSGNGEQVVSESYRSESMPTTPVGGSYVESTNYEAFFAETIPEKYDFWTVHPSNSEKTYHHKGISRASTMFPYPETYGSKFRDHMSHMFLRG